MGKTHKIHIPTYTQNSARPCKGSAEPELHAPRTFLRYLHRGVEAGLEDTTIRTAAVEGSLLSILNINQYIAMVKPTIDSMPPNRDTKTNDTSQPSASIHERTW